MTVQDYLNLVTSEYQNSTNFLATIAVDVGVPVQVQSLLNSMIGLFSLDTPPVGDQLDIIGEWVGVSRQINTPISDAFFTWNGAISQGWNYGSWRDPSDPDATEIVILPDDAYLNLIKSRIAANSWDGTTGEFYSILNAAFPQFLILLIDNQNMSYSLGIVGTPSNPVDTLTLGLLTGGYIPMRPEGVMVSDYFVNTDSNPLFAWNSDTPLLQGWNLGSWVTELPPT